MATARARRATVTLEACRIQKALAYNRGRHSVQPTYPVGGMQPDRPHV